MTQRTFMRHSELPNRHSKIPKFAGEPAIVDEVRAFQLNLRADSVEPLRSIFTAFHVNQSSMYLLCDGTSAPGCESNFKHASCVLSQRQTGLH